MLGVQHLYQNKVVHRDLNIKNVLIHYTDLELSREDLQRMSEFWFRKSFQNKLEAQLKKRLQSCNFVIKIADLGYARKLLHGAFAESLKGTPLLYAPELIIKRIYNHKVDVWGIANIFYSGLTGRLLFEQQNGDYEKQLEKGTWTVPFDVKLSAEALNFLHDLLKFEPEKRLSIDQLVNHPYLNIPLTDLKPF